MILYNVIKLFDSRVFNKLVQFYFQASLGLFLPKNNFHDTIILWTKKLKSDL